MKLADQIWDNSEIEYWLRDAAHTLKAIKLSGRDIPSSKASFWPEIVRDVSEGYGWSEAVARRPIPTSEAIDKMDKAIGWLLLLTDDQRRIAWARAEGIPWRKLEDWDGRSRTTLQKVHNEALGLIAHRLNAPMIAHAISFTWGTGTGGMAYG